MNAVNFASRATVHSSAYLMEQSRLKEQMDRAHKQKDDRLAKTGELIDPSASATVQSSAAPTPTLIKPPRLPKPPKSQTELLLEWQQFRDANPEVMQFVLTSVTAAFAAGKRRGEINDIWCQARKHLTTNQTQPFKMPHNHRAYCAREFMELYPQFGRFFRTAALPSEGSFPVDRFGQAR